MKIHELQLTKKTSQKRVGRGIGSGYGKTAGRGTKGQNARAGGGVRPGFEGGQNPLSKRLPKKRGFKPVSRIEYVIISLTRLEELTSPVSNASLVKAGIVPNIHTPVKVLGNGSLKKKVVVNLQAATQTAITAIEKAGGSFTISELAKNPKKPSKRNRQS